MINTKTMNKLVIFIFFLSIYSLCLHSQTKKHIVKADETTFSIAQKYNINHDELLKYNPQIENGLKVGSEIIILNNNNTTSSNQIPKNIKLEQIDSSTIVPSEQNQSPREVFSVVDEYPEYTQGEAQLKTKILVWMMQFKKKEKRGTCFVRFIVCPDGSISDVTITKGIADCPECDKHVLELMRRLSKWNPGKIGGKPVYTLMNLPIKFGYSQPEKIEKIENLENLTPNSTNLTFSQTRLSNYDVLCYVDPVHKEGYRYDLKVFNGTISNNNSIVSLIFGMPKNGLMSSYGNHLISTNRSNGITTDLFWEHKMGSRQEFYYQNKGMGITKLNSNLSQFNTIFFSHHNGDAIELNEIKLSNNSDIPSIETYRLPYEFELNSGNDIETFILRTATLGNEICGFIGKSLHDDRAYLFIYDYKSKSKYRKIDLTKVSSSFSNLTSRNNSHINLTYKENSIETYFQSIFDIVQNENFIYLFLMSVDRKFTLPICISKSNNSVSIKSNSLFNLGGAETDNMMNITKFTGGFNYLPFSKEFINFYKFNNGIKLDVYNKAIDKTWSATLNDISVNHINEVGNFIIIGGFTESAGYKGFPNPKIVVINKTSHNVCYSKVLTKKNAEVNSISLDSDNNIIITIGGVIRREEKVNEFYPQIIIDKLGSDGKFINDLFIKK